MSNLDATVKRLDATVSTSNIERFGIMEAEIEHLKERLTSEGTAEMAKDVGELGIRVSEIEALFNDKQLEIIKIYTALGMQYSKHCGKKDRDGKDDGGRKG